jgi:hypothetical protein
MGVGYRYQLIATLNRINLNFIFNLPSIKYNEIEANTLWQNGWQAN